MPIQDWPISRSCISFQITKGTSDSGREHTSDVQPKVRKRLHSLDAFRGYATSTFISWCNLQIPWQCVLASSPGPPFYSKLFEGLVCEVTGCDIIFSDGGWLHIDTHPSPWLLSGMPMATIVAWREYLSREAEYTSASYSSTIGFNN